MIDGFDEIDELFQEESLSGISRLSNKYPLCRIAITSRPDYPCEFLSNFNNYNLKPLSIGDLNNFYRKLTRDKVFTEKLCQAIKKSPTKIQDLIKTPLLATLLAISYKSAQKIPLEFSEFYEQLFQILLIRHDGAKLGWHRERRSKLTDEEMQKVFECLCFKSRKINSLNFSKENFHDLAKKAIDSVFFVSKDKNISRCKESDYVSDIKKITCLVISEAQGYSFIHNSVPEFFSAKYIKSLSEARSIKFYSRIREEKWKKWRSEITFLEQIDNFRFIKHFQTPDISDCLMKMKMSNQIELLEVINFLKSITIKKITDINQVSGLQSFRYTYHHPHVNSGYTCWNLINRCVMICTSDSYQKWDVCFDINQNSNKFTLSEIISFYHVEKQNEIFRLIFNYISEINKMLIINVKKIAALEEVSDFDDL